MTENTPFPAASLLGYPRIGRRRELKKAVESYWAGRIDAAELAATAQQIQLGTAQRLQELGLTEVAAVPGTFSYYDQVLDAAAHVGAIPARFGNLLDADGGLGLAGYFTLARGDREQQPLEMTKWFDSNYHYLVPEIGPDTVFSVTSDRIVRDFAAVLESGIETRPYLVGPVTFLLLSKAEAGAPADFAPLAKLAELLPVYAALLERLAAAGASWVQLDEPALVADGAVPAAELRAAVEQAYRVLGSAQSCPKLLVSTPYGALGELLEPVASLPVEAIHLDLFKGELPADLTGLAQALAGKTLVAGVVDGHNIWRNDLAASARKLDALKAAGINLAVSTSTSAFHVPHDSAEEAQLTEQLRSWLAFADQKAVEVATLAGHLADAEAARPEIEAASRIIASRASAEGVRRSEVRARTAALAETDFHRA